VEDEALDRLVTVELRAAFEKLTEIQRDVLSLRIIGHLTLEETADVVGKRVGAVKAAQRRGLLALREHLDLERVSR
jgi:RNA polymerase sigma-70 factor (ECF subfamily)